MRSWPKKYAGWADGDPQAIGKCKVFDVWDPFCETTLVGSPELQDCLKNDWPEELHPAIRCLSVHSFNVFNQSTQRRAPKRKRTEVSHAQFIDILDKWLVSNCPDFKDFGRLDYVYLLYVTPVAFRSHFVGI